MSEKHPFAAQKQEPLMDEHVLTETFRNRPGMKILFYVSLGVMLLGVLMCVLIGFGIFLPNH